MRGSSRTYCPYYTLWAIYLHATVSDYDERVDVVVVVTVCRCCHRLIEDRVWDDTHSSRVVVGIVAC